MRIDEEFKNLIPPLTEEEHKQLEENILQDGIREPLVVWAQENILIDGHNRYEIAQEHGLLFEIKYIDFVNRDDVIAWIIRNQFGRRNLTAFQRSELALKLKPIIAEQAKKQQGTRTDISQISVKSHDTQKELAKVAGVSHDSIHKVEKVLREGSEETKAAARSGKISVNEAYKRTVKENEPPKPDIPTAKEEHEAFKSAQIVSMDDIEVDKNNKRIIAIDFHNAIMKVADMFEYVFIKENPNELAEDAEGLTKAERVFLVSRMMSIENCVNTVINILRGDM